MLVVPRSFNKILPTVSFHTSKTVKNFMTEKNIPILDWPGNSPEANPIENLWAI